MKSYFLNPHSKLPHHWVLGIATAIVGILALYIPIAYVLIGSGAFIAAHDLFYHRRHGWEGVLKFRK